MSCRFASLETRFVACANPPRRFRRIHSRLHHTRRAELRQHRSHVGKQIASIFHEAFSTERATKPSSSAESLMPKTFVRFRCACAINLRQGAAQGTRPGQRKPRTNGWLDTPSGPSYKDTQGMKMSLKGPTNNRLRGNNRVTGALLVPRVQRTRLPLLFMGNASSHT